jgi:hypothetical protein
VTAVVNVGMAAEFRIPRMAPARLDPAVESLR